MEGKHGIAWGKLFWRGTFCRPLFVARQLNASNINDILDIPGKLVSDHEERIPGGLKYAWREGISKAPPKPNSQS